MTGVCLSDVDYQKFALSNEEWEKLGQLMKFLQPLNTATERLAGSRFPTLEKALPIFFALIVQLKKVRSYDFKVENPRLTFMFKHIEILQVEKTYDSEQLLQPVRDIIQKLERYLKATLKKPVYLHAVILDPRIKISFFDKHAEHFA